MNMNNPRIALIGCGAVVQQFHLPALEKVGIKPTVLIDPNLEQSKTLAKCYDSKVEIDYQPVMDEFDAAIVSVPNKLHAPICLDLIKNGKHVFVEKPMATTIEECDDMLAIALDRNVQIAVGHFRRYLMGARWVKSFLQSGGLGAIESIDIREGFIYGWPVTSDSVWKKEKAGGGVLIDTGAHTLDLLCWWLGDINKIEYKDNAFNGVETDCILNFIMESGAKGIVELSRTRKLRNTAIIKGAKGTLEIGLSNNKISIDNPELNKIKHNGYQANKIPPQSLQSLFADQIRDWVSALKDEKEPYVPGVEGARSISVIDRCYSTRKQWVLPWIQPDNSVKKPVDVKTGALNNRPVLITGATGFIGGRLVEKLVLEQNTDVRCAVRDYSKAARLARFNIEMPIASLTDLHELEKAIDGCEVVYHCAYDQTSPQNNIIGARHIAELCLKYDVRLVHVSTISVYEPLPDGDLDESGESIPVGMPYADNKLEVEELILRYANEKGLKAVVLQPTIVYGPFCIPWTASPVNQLSSGIVILPDDGQGLCNPVYVDDVCDAMILAGIKENVTGHRFLISGSERITWGEFYHAFEKILDVQAVTYMTSEDITRMDRSPVSNMKLIISNPKRILQWELARNFAFFIRDHIPQKIKTGLESIYTKFSSITPRPTYLPNNQLLALYSAKCNVKIDKAKSMLGYDSSYDFASGMKLTSEFIRWAFPHLIENEESIISDEATNGIE